MVAFIFWRIIAAMFLGLFRGKMSVVLLCVAYLVGCAMGFLDGLGLISLDFIPRS